MNEFEYAKKIEQDLEMEPGVYGMWLQATSRGSITGNLVENHQILLGWQKVILHSQSFAAIDLLQKRHSSSFSNPLVHF